MNCCIEPRIMNLDHFKDLVIRCDWSRIQSHDVIDCEHDLAYSIGDSRFIRGAVTVASSLFGVLITYTEFYCYDKSGVNPLATSGSSISIYGVKVLDGNGDAMHTAELQTYLPEEFKLVDYSEIFDV